MDERELHTDGRSELKTSTNPKDTRRVESTSPSANGFVVAPGTELVSFLGTGTVCQAGIVTFRGNDVVCKRLTPRMRLEPIAIRALERETRLLGTIVHASVPRLIESGSDDHGPYVLQSWARGTPLVRLMERGPLPSALVRSLAVSAFQALSEIHGSHDRHGPLDVAVGDLAPDDIVLGSQPGRLCFVDFGQSNWRGEPARSAERGTLPYAPPEVTRGDEPWSQASDVYALAAILTHALLGGSLCEADGVGRITEIGERGLQLERLRNPTPSGPLPSPHRDVLLRELAFEEAPRRATAKAVLAAWNIADQLATDPPVRS